MNKAERLRRTKNIIARRWRLLMSWMVPRDTETKEEAQSRQMFTPHHLHKYNLNCGCHACRSSKQFGKYKRAKAKRRIRQEIEEQLDEPGFKFK